MFVCPTEVTYTTVIFVPCSTLPVKQGLLKEKRRSKDKHSKCMRREESDKMDFILMDDVYVDITILTVNRLN